MNLRESSQAPLPAQSIHNPTSRPPASTAAKCGLALLAALGIWFALEMVFRILPPPPPARKDRPAILFYPEEFRLHPWSRDFADPLRIAVVGDSITQGTGCQPQDTYGMRLESLLNHNAGQRPAEVRIWAQGGDSTYLEVRHLKTIVPWKPQLLILGICLNDTENSHKKAQLMHWRKRALPAPPPPALAAILRHSRLGSWIYGKIAARQARNGYLEYYRRIYDRNYSGWRLFVKAIHDFRATCQENGIILVPVIFPLFSDVDRYPFEWVHRQITEVLQSEELLYLDLLDTFRGHSPRRLQVIPLVDAHPNEIAHRQAAEAIFQFLLAHRLVDAGYLPRQTGSTPEQLWKVLDRMIHQTATTDVGLAKQLIEPEAPSGSEPP